MVNVSPLDARGYDLVTLDNGMRALLVSDPDTDMAAASLQVHVGHYADPGDREGLAHFLEHMLFMGTDKYPDVEEYRRFVEAHGGSTNAGTGGETTSYFFQVEHSALDGAFDRFARFFVAPVLDPAYVERERNAVNSEYTLKIQDEARRTRQVRKVNTNPAHPESKFSVGNHDTLADREGSPVYEDLRELYDAHYRADQMTVAVIGRESLDELRAMVTSRLSEVRAGTGEPEATRPAPFTTEQLGVRIDLVPLKEVRAVELRFPMPPQQPLWPMRPLGYVSSILGHEGDGTLFAALKQAGWIESLSSGQAAGADDYDELSIRIGLTEAGADHIDEIVAACMAAVARVEAKGVEAFRLSEDRTQRLLAFTFREEPRPSQLVRGATRALWYYPARNVLDHPSQVAALDPARLQAVLDAVRPDNLRLFVTLPGTPTDQVEPLYDVPYSVRPLSEAERTAFAAGTELAFELPLANPYLPADTALIDAPDASLPAPLDAGRVELWHLADTTFRVPRAKGFVRLSTPAARADRRARVMMSLYGRLLADSLEEFRYPLVEAGLSFSVSATDRGVTVGFAGYHDAQERMLGDLFARVAGFEVDPERFEIQRAKAVREWKNRAKARPINQAFDAMYEAIYPWRVGREEAVEVASQLTAADLQAFAASVFDEATAQMLVHGNHTEAGARALAAIVEESLLGDATPGERLAPVVRTPTESVVRDVEVDHPDSSIAVIVAQPATRDAASHARWQMLGQLLDTPFFSQLRTEQQLGYVVFASYARLHDVPGLRMGIQSGVAGPVTLLDRIDTFLAEHQATIADMPEEEFATLRDGLLAKLREAETELYRRSDRLASELDREILTFDWREQVAQAVEGLDRATMSAFYAEVLETPRLVVRSFGTNHPDERAEATRGCTDTACVAEKMAVRR